MALAQGRQDERSRCLDQPDQDAAGKGAEHAAEAARIANNADIRKAYLGL